MTNEQTLYEGEILVGYEDSRGTTGTHKVGSFFNDPKIPRYFVGKNVLEVLEQQTLLLESISAFYIGKPSPACRQDRDLEATIRKANTALKLKEISRLETP